jgi:16S rRNA (guanine1207-N2)-methyltransferase
MFRNAFFQNRILNTLLVNQKLRFGKGRPTMFQAVLNNIPLTFETSKELFSPKAIDLGTEFMLSKVEFTSEDKVLDLGCGYGVVGILAAKLIGPERVVMVDINTVAVKMAKENAAANQVGDVIILESDGLSKVVDFGFTLILTNPPYHVDFSVPKHFIEKGFNHLKIGGKLFMVTKRKDWYKNKLISVFGGVKIWEENGYYVFMAQKMQSSYSK